MGTEISWADETWNPTTGCTRVSPGCDRCYIERTIPFRMAGRKFDGEGPGSATGVLLHPDRLDKPLHWRKPRLVFVNSLSDLFHDDVRDDFIAGVFTTMALAPQHTFQVLTKRPGRMRSLLSRPDFEPWVRDISRALKYGDGQSNPRMNDRNYATWPLPNVWLGTSVESQQWARVRIPLLQGTPAAVRFLSCEPLLGPLDLEQLGVCNAPWNYTEFGVECSCRGAIVGPDERCNRSLDWVIAGGESGPGARPMHPQWVRSLRDQCEDARVPFHFKQWGEWAPGILPTGTRKGEVGRGFYSGPTVAGSPTGQYAMMSRVGKAAAGREIDGRVHDAFPESVSA